MILTTSCDVLIVEQELHYKTLERNFVKEFLHYFFRVALHTGSERGEGAFMLHMSSGCCGLGLLSRIR
jgi:hypothetical protein